MLLRLTTSFVLLLGLTSPVTRAAEAPRNEQPKIPVEQIIDAFVQKETEFAVARESYTYRQSVKMTEYNEGNRPAGSWLVQDVIFGPKRERSERVVFAPVPTLRLIQLTPQDEQDLRDVQPFVMTNDNRNEYDIAYLGTETIDEIECYVFSVKPIKLEKGKRYFQGQIWVDQRDLQIVKTYGKGVGLLKKNEDNQFPAFETYRNQIDGKYWFPVYTRADDVLHFRNGDIRVKMVIKYEDYKRYGAESQITFGEAVDEPGATIEPPVAPEAIPDPEVGADPPRIAHALQTAEKAREDGRPDWMQLVGLIHDAGKMLCFWGEPHWAAVGDTFPVGCAFSDKIVYPEYFAANPDSTEPMLSAEMGIYELGCGLDSVLMAWGHDERIYPVLREPKLPAAAPAMLRHHSFDPWRREGAYAQFMGVSDPETLFWVREFNQYDLCSKSDAAPDVAPLRPYYQGLIDKYPLGRI